MRMFKRGLEPLKVLVVGTGSVGSRHIQNLLALGAKVSAYSYRKDRAAELHNQYAIKVFSSLDEALESNQDGVVVSNRPDQHMEVAIAAAQKGLHLYIEKPLSNSTRCIEEFQSLARSNSLVIEIGCTMRFHPGLIKVREFLKTDSIGLPYFARACVGQYFPDWRPGQDYRHSYGAKVKYGGGVLFDLIHELDYLYWWFGNIREVSAFLGHLSDLEIETEDIAQLLLRFQNGPVAQVHMDYLRPFYCRTCEIVGSEGVIVWDYSSGIVGLKVKGVDGQKTFSTPKGFERNTMFLDHMKHFLNRIQNGGKPAVSLDDAIHVLNVALAAHHSSEEGKVFSV